jgi:hypothetical protein
MFYANICVIKRHADAGYASATHLKLNKYPYQQKNDNDHFECWIIYYNDILYNYVQ